MDDKNTIQTTVSGLINDVKGIMWKEIANF